MLYFVISHLRYVYIVNAYSASLQDHNNDFYSYWHRPEIPAMKLWVVTHNDNVVASIATRPTDVSAMPDGQKRFVNAYDSPCSRAELERMYVLEEYRGRGIAKMMVRHVIRFCKQHGFSSLHLFTGTRMSEACALYDSMGFIVSDVKPTSLGKILYYKMDL